MSVAAPSAELRRRRRAAATGSGAVEASDQGTTGTRDESSRDPRRDVSSRPDASAVPFYSHLTA